MPGVVPGRVVDAAMAVQNLSDANEFERDIETIQTESTAARRSSQRTTKSASVAGTRDALRGSTLLLRAARVGGRRLEGPLTGPTVPAYRPGVGDSGAGSRVVFVRLVSRLQPWARISGCGGLLVPVKAVCYSVVRIVAQRGSASGRGGEGWRDWRLAWRFAILCFRVGG